MKAMIIVSNGLEECEALVTYDLLYRAGIDVKLVGLNKTVVSSHNVSFEAHETIDGIDPSAYERNKEAADAESRMLSFLFLKMYQVYNC